MILPPAGHLEGIDGARRTSPFDVDGDGIALMTWDVPGRSMNVFTLDAIAELAGIVETLAGDARVKGVVITSARTRSAPAPT